MLQKAQDSLGLRISFSVIAASVLLALCSLWYTCSSSQSAPERVEQRLQSLTEKQEATSVLVSRLLQQQEATNTILRRIEEQGGNAAVARPELKAESKAPWHVAIEGIQRRPSDKGLQNPTSCLAQLPVNDYHSGGPCEMRLFLLPSFPTSGNSLVTGICEQVTGKITGRVWRGAVALSMSGIVFCSSLCVATAHTHKHMYVCIYTIVRHGLPWL